MSTFIYTARNKNGNFERGEIIAANKDTAVELITEKDYSVISLNEKRGSLAFLKSIKNYSFVPAMEKVLFARQLSTLLNAGVPLAQSLSMLSKQASNKKMAEVIKEVSKSVEGGASLSQAMLKHEKLFGSIFVNMVSAGEIGGILDKTMDRMAEQLEKDHEIVAKVRGAMMYPAIIVVAMGGSVLFMMTSIIPQLGKMFEDMNAELPGSTKLLMNISTALTDYGFLTFIGTVSLFLLLRYIVKNVNPVRRKIHFLILHTPILGKASKKINVARFARTFGTLLESGIAIVETLDIIAKATPNLIIKEDIYRIKEEVGNGVSLAVAIEKSKCFPLLVAQMMSVGEEGGLLSEISLKISDYYEKELDNIIKNLTTLLEPIMMLLIGVMIGFMMVSIIKPIYQLTNMF